MWSTSRLSQKRITSLLVASWLILLFSLQGTVGAGEQRTYTSTMTTYSPRTVTEYKEETVVQTLVKTVTGPKVVETMLRTYTTVTTKRTIYQMTYRYTTITSLSKMGGHGHDQNGWVTVYIFTDVVEQVPVTVTTPARVQTSVSGLVTLTKSTVTTCLTEFKLSVNTQTRVRTVTVTKVLLSEYVEVMEGGEQRFGSILRDYGLIIVAAIIIGILAILPKSVLRMKPAGARAGFKKPF